VIRLGALGDVVRTLPAVSSLRAGYPGSHLAWLVEPAAAGVLAGQPWVDEVLVFPRDDLGAALERRDAGAAARLLLRFARDLRRRRFDLVLDFHSIGRSALLALASGARRRVGYARPFGRELSWLLASDRVRPSAARISRFERSQALVHHLGLHQAPAARPLRVDVAARSRMAAALGPGAAPVAMHAGSSAAAARKRYPPAALARVARGLADALGLRTIATWGPAPGDREAALALVAAAGGAACLAPETRDAGELAALLAGCRLFVGADTGPLHVASLVNTPVVQILGPTDPIENAPWPGTRSRSLRAPGGRPAELRPESVLEAALELLDAQAGHAA